jgi:FixJ family two-component response regulator/glycine cleavage system H lipoate-binding protein
MIYKANILVVDDDQSLCKSVAAVLKKEGYTVDTVFSAEEALKKTKETRYALMFVDLMLPGMSGIELLTSIKESYPDTTFIMITGYPSIKSAVQAIKLSAYDFIPKPFTPEEIRTLTARALEGRHTYEEIASRLNIKEEKLVDISIPADVYCIHEHSWAKVEEDGNVRIGIHHALAKTLKGIAAIEFPDINEMRFQGEACVRIVDSHEQVIRLWTPITGMVTAVNEELKNDYTRAVYDPYESGWLVKIEPTHLEEELKNLTLLKKEP